MGIIRKPSELEIEPTMAMLIYGQPGIGKTTLACSAPDPVLFDCDHGVHRINGGHQVPTVQVKKWEDVNEALTEIESGKEFKTIVIDTGGALVEMLKQYVIDHPQDFKGGAKAMGGISLQGYGFVKTLWSEFTLELRQNFNVVYIFHEQAEKNGDDGTFYSIVVEGAAKNVVWQSADLAARLFINNGQRYLGFTPTEQYSAKSSFGIKGLVEVPELKDGSKNDFLEKLFAKVRKNLAEENANLNPKKEQYNEVMEAAKRVCSEISKPADVKDAMEMIQNLPHVLTSAKEAKAMFKNRLDELGIIYDKSTQTYGYAEQK